MTKKAVDTQVIKDKLRGKKVPEQKPIRLSTGSTQLNLACSGRPGWAFEAGNYYLFVGDSAAGKTWLVLQTAAELCSNPAFDGWRVIVDPTEDGAKMDVKKFFGRKLADRLEMPSPRGPSRTLEEMYDNIDDAAKDGRPFFYAVDSEDALPPEEAIKRLEKDKRARRKVKVEGEGTDRPGSYGTAKAKINSNRLGMAHAAVKRAGGILIIVKQSRENIGYDATFNPKTRSGGKALTFYATLELWFSKAGKIKRTVRGKPRTIGDCLKVAVKKNRVSGRERSVNLRFYPFHGFDDVGSLVEWLVEEGHWEGKPKGDRVVAPEFDFDGAKEKLVQLIEERNEERKLRMLAADVWSDIETQCELKRKPRYQ